MKYSKIFNLMEIPKDIYSIPGIIGTTIQIVKYDRKNKKITLDIIILNGDIIISEDNIELIKEHGYSIGDISYGYKFQIGNTTYGKAGYNIKNYNSLESMNKEIAEDAYNSLITQILFNI